MSGAAPTDQRTQPSLLPGLHALQLPWLDRRNGAGVLGRDHYLKLRLIRSCEFHFKLDILRCDEQRAVGQFGLTDRVITRGCLNGGKFPTLRVHNYIGVSDRSGQRVLLFRKLDRLKSLALEFRLPGADKCLQVSVCVLVSSDLNGESR